MLKRIIMGCLVLIITKSALSSNIFIRNGLSEANHQTENMDVFYAINSGAWIPVNKLDMSNSNSLSDLIDYKEDDRIKFKIVTADKRFITESLLMPNFNIDRPHMVEIKGTTLPEEIHIRFDSVFGRGLYKRPFKTDSGRQYQAAICGGTAVIIACAIGNYGELVMQFAGLTTTPVFAGSSYIDETFFDQLEKGEKVELLDNRGQYFSGIFYHEVKIWDRSKGEIFDLKAGGIGMGFGEAVSIKFTRW